MQEKSLKNHPFWIKGGELFFGKAVGDGDMAVALGIDTLHLLAKKAAVRRGVAELIDGDVIMDHLMEDGIFDKLFGQVDTGVDTEDEVRVMGRPKEPGTMFGEGEFAKKCAGMGEFDGNKRKRPAEKAGIEHIKAGLDVGKRGLHLGFKFQISVAKVHKIIDSCKYY